MQETLFDKVQRKYGEVLDNCLYASQIELLEMAIEALEKGVLVNIRDAFTRLAFELIVRDLMHEKRKG